MDQDQEVVYRSHDESHVVMSEKVQSLAGSIYQEFEKMISKYDEDVVKDLMPLVVNVLECLDLSFTENQEHEVELELLREDNEQLVTQYEREKQLRKETDKRLLEIEDVAEDERKELVDKVESLESILQILELKNKNTSDHVQRLEESLNETKEEASKMHERYTELLKTHLDCIERTKLLMGPAERADTVPVRPRIPNSLLTATHMSRSSGPVSFGFASLEGSAGFKSMAISAIELPPTSELSPVESDDPASLKSELNDLSRDRSHSLEEESSSVISPSEKGWSETLASVHKDDSSPEEISEDPPPLPPIPTTPLGKSHTRKEQRSGNTLYQELSFQDAEALNEMDDGADLTGNFVHPGDYASSVTDNFFGMGKEVENLIMENNELLATKNALNIVKDDLIIKVDELTSEQEILRTEIKSLKSFKSKLIQKVAELEDDLKRSREETEKFAREHGKSDDEEDVPMAQRKRFTRVEMARVLMERNQYKEKFFELQDAVKWSEMIRATRNDPMDKKSKQTIWKFFSSLFSGSNDSRIDSSGMDMSPRNTLNYVKYNAPTNHVVSPGIESIRKRNLSERRKGFDYIDTADISSERTTAKRAIEKRDQFRQVRAHVNKSDGRLCAYGWSLPGRSSTPKPLPPPPPPSHQAHIPVPVPVYCRPLMEHEPGTKLWCATGVNLSGGKTPDGGAIVGASVFYSQPNLTNEHKNKRNSIISASNEDIAKISQELKEGEKLLLENENPNYLQQNRSSLVWICTSTNTGSSISSRVTIIDANNPADILLSFNVCPSYLLCISSIPGASENDYDNNCSDNINVSETITIQPDSESDNPSESVANEGASSSPEKVNIGKITFISCATGSAVPPEREDLNTDDVDNSEVGTTKKVVTSVDSSYCGSGEEIECSSSLRLVKEIKEGLVKDGLSDLAKESVLSNEQVEKLSSVLPTIWLGSHSGHIFVHSAVSQWKRCLHSVKLQDSVLNIVHVLGRVVCAMANGTVAVFKRGADGQWDLTQYYSVTLGSCANSVRCLSAVHSKVWCSYKNRIHVLDPKTLQIQKSIDAHPRKDSQVRQMAWLGDGVWVSIRLDSTLRLYHAHTYQHLQDVDIEPYVSKMLGTGKSGFSFVRITALLISSYRLWIGTGNGVIISVPLSESSSSNGTNITPSVSRINSSSNIRVFSDPATSQVTPGSFIPYCCMTQAQLSFHGHKDAVKFFVAVPGCGGISSATCNSNDAPMLESFMECESLPSMLVISGGEGYIDFRNGDTDSDGQSDNREARIKVRKDSACHVIVWQVNVCPFPSAFHS